MKRFDEKYVWDPVTDCLVWTAARHPKGYGRFAFQGKNHLAHRVAWFLEHGEWPSLDLDHLCENTGCVNVEHLEDVTNAENMRRRYDNLTSCKRGHPVSEMSQQKRQRVCNACRREDYAEKVAS